MSEDTQSWDAFWAEVDRETHAPTEVICGIKVRVPTDITLRFEARVAALTGSDSEEDVQDLVAELFGDDVFRAWVDAGMTGRQFQTALGWGMAHAKGRPVSFREAYELVLATEDGRGNEAAATLAPNRQQRRAAQRQPSAATGGRSSRTSNGSTGSRRSR